MNPQQPVHVSQIVPTQNFSQGGYPGLSQVTPFFPEAQNPIQPTPKPSTGSNILSNLNFKDIKGFVDRMGGVDGILGTISKVQKAMQTFQQMGPMLKLLLPKLGTNSAGSDDYPRRRRRRRRRSRGQYSTSPYSSSRSRVRRSSSKRKKRKVY